MPRLRAVWATTELTLTLLVVAWGLALFVNTRHAVWSGGNFAAAAFFLVAAYLFGRDHPDGRIVGVIGLLIFLFTNAFLLYSFLTEGVPGLDLVDRDVSGFNAWENAFPWFLGTVMAFVAVPQGILLAFGHKPMAPEPTEP